MKLLFRFSLIFILTVLTYGVLLYSFTQRDLRAQKIESKISEQKDELQRIRQELEDKREKIKKLFKKESSVFVQIQNLEEELELIDRLISRLNQESRKTSKEISTEEGLLKNSQFRLQDQREELGCRLRDIYKYMRFREYEILTGASSPLDLMRRLRYIKLITQQDQALIRGISSDITGIQETRKSLETKRNELVQLIREKDKEEKRRTLEKDKNEKLLRSIRTEKEIYLSSIQELEKSAKEIEKLLASLEAKRSETESETQGGIFRALKGRLPWPIRGKLALGFGQQEEKRFKTKVFNPGIDISPESEEVKAVADGKVVYSSWLRGYGNFIILQHDGGFYTVYANLKEVFADVGENISQSQTIARVSGSPAEDNLHFEIRKGKEQLDPLEWLK
ncbi:MAG TPA: peptidoglycan DD-metalloendopeptidase family protein [Terriglobales bacterium]|nr:peptidoglycan DD-metalloendopeptidase family protein [Terriglobales bacterium]